MAWAPIIILFGNLFEVDYALFLTISYGKVVGVGNKVEKGKGGNPTHNHINICIYKRI